MTQSEKQQKLEKQQNTVFKILWIPIVLLLGAVPLIVRLQGVQLTEQVQQLIGETMYGDFFSQYKATAIIGIIIIMAVIGFLLFQKDFIKKDKKIVTYGVLMLVYGAFTFISALLAEHKDIAMWGYHDRAEGAVMLLCYVGILFYTIYIFRKTSDYKYIVVALGVLVVLNTIVGVFQYVGKDLFMAGGAFNNLIIPEKYADLANNVDTLYEKQKVYGTLYHYNYMGSFVAIIIPLFGALTIFISGYKSKIVCGLVTICGALLLFGSSSRAALVGIAISGVFAVVFFGKVIIRKWKLVLPIIALAVAGVIGIGVMTDGAVFDRIPSLVNDAIGMFIPTGSDFDYKKELPISNIVSENGETIITMKQGELILSSESGTLEIVDQNGNTVPFDIVDNVATTSDERFKELKMKLIYQEGQEKPDGIVLLVNDIKCFVLIINAETGVQLVDGHTNKPLELKDAPYWGFEGKEKLGSARGYIWSRTIPMLKDTMLIGNGPDTYALEFPQDDYLAKWWAYGTPNIVVDKPHNLYLQIWVNQGALALLAFLALIIIYLIDCIKLYGLKVTYNSSSVLGVATMLGVIGYLGAGLFNDSVVSVAPIFWILLGVGISINYIIKKENLEYQRRLEHATIDMKSRRVINKQTIKSRKN